MESTEEVVAELRELQARIRVLEDEREIHALLSHFSTAFEFRRYDEWLDLWTEDGVTDYGLDSPTVQKYGIADGRFVGREGLMKLIDVEGNSGFSQHHNPTGILIIDVDGDTATAEGYSFTIVKRDGLTEQLGRSHEFPYGIWGAAFNRWTLKRVNGRWKVAERFRRLVGSDQAPSVLAPPRVVVLFRDLTLCSPRPIS